MDPVARSAAQRAARKAAQNKVDVASEEREEPEVTPGDREKPEVTPGDREEPEVTPGDREVADREQELADRERARPALETTGSASIPTAERPQSTPAVDVAVRPFSFFEFYLYLICEGIDQSGA